MAEQGLQITFQPSGKRVHVEAGATVRDAATPAGIALDFPCGGQGSCGKCRVRLSSPDEPLDTERRHLPPDELADGYRLACQCRLNASTIVEVPDHSLLGKSYQILEATGRVVENQGESPVRLVSFEAPEPTREDDVADVVRLERVLGPIDAGLDMLRALSARLRSLDFRGVAVLSGRTLIDVVEEDHEPILMAAFDIGTTTLVGTLHRAPEGLQLARASRMNPQTSFGDDVLSRIAHAGQEPGHLAQVHRAVIEAINEMIDEMAVDAGVAPDRIVDVTFAGNTTMEHLLLGIDPHALGQVPFVAATRQAVELDAREIGLTIHPRGRAYVFPIIGGFVGGDTVAGVVATELLNLPGSTLFVDIGTNGEIVARYNHHLLATSCAAGPAFEGARIRHGMRAAPGAIEEVRLADDVSIRVIGDAKPIGLCGSALIDAVAEMLRVGILRGDGVIRSGDDLPGDIPEALRTRVRLNGDHPEFVLAWDDETQTGRAIALTQRDIRELQLGTGAIRSGIETILARINLPVGQLDRLLVAGAFGNYIRCENAQRMGLLPAGMPSGRIHFVGNTSLSGAQLAAISQSVRDEAARLAGEAEHVDLSSDPQFYEFFVEALQFPEGVDVPDEATG